MKLARKLIALNLAFLLIFTMLPLTAWAASEDLGAGGPITFAEPNEDGYTFTPSETGLYTATFATTVDNAVSGGNLLVYGTESDELYGVRGIKGNWATYCRTLPLQQGKTYTIKCWQGWAKSNQYTLSIAKTVCPTLSSSPTSFSAPEDYIGNLFFQYAPTTAGWYTFSASQALYMRTYNSDFEVVDRGYAGDPGLSMFLDAGQTYYLWSSPDFSGNISVSPSNFPTLTTESSTSIKLLPYTFSYLTFTPTLSGSCTIKAETNNPYGVAFVDIFNDKQEYLAGDTEDKELDADYSAEITYNFTAGTTYYIGIYGADEVSGMVTATYNEAPAGLAQWTNLYPANGATNVGYKADAPAHYQITFDREIANDGALADVNLTSDGAFAIYRASDDSLIYKPSQYASSDYKIVYQSENILSITPVNNHTLLEPGTEYYITMGEGFVHFSDGSTNQAINKGDWVFSTKLFEKKGDFTYLSKDSYDTKYSYSYSDSYFEGLSNKYNHELANMSISLALSAFNSSSSMASEYEPTTAAKNVRALLSDINFDEKSIDTSSYKGKPQKDTIGVAFGKKEVSYSSGDYTLVAVAIRGAGYEAEWGGNLTVGRNENHAGFQIAADSVLSRLKEYIHSQEISGNLKIWITGYSRAAATANLVAAALDDGELFSGINPVSRSSVSLKRTDVYAYIFETPMATTNSNSSQYDNIFNIVNPIDPVPKVAPEGWDFTRYGVTYYMPTSEGLTFNEYRNIILRVNTEYANIIKVTPGSSSSFIKALSNQGTILNNFLNYLSVKLPRNTYSPGYEDLIAPIIAEVTNSGKTDAEAIASTVLEFCVRHPKEAKTIIDAMEAAVGSKVFWFVVAEQGFEQLYKLVGWEGTTATEVITLLFDTITQSHIPEVTLAWMRTINGADEYGSGMTRRLYVNCPVNISVYDSSNQLVAQIIDDEPQLIDDSLIGTYVDGAGQKIIILPNNEKYRIALTATDDGTVTYTATEYSLDTGNSERVVSYYEVEVINGDELTAIAENLSEVSLAEYPLYLNDSSESLEPTINQIGDDVTKHTVTVTVLGNGKAFGGGSYISGEFSHVEAEPNDGERFLGWYVGNSLISEELEYRFLVDTSYDIIARFTTNTNQGSGDYPHVPDTPSTPSGSGGSSSSSSNPSYQITVSTTSNGIVTVTPKSAKSGNKVTITTTPNYGYITGSVTVADRDGKSISATDNGDGTHTFTMPASRVTVSVLFTAVESSVPSIDVPDETSWVNPFIDVLAGEWYYDAVKFVSENSLMNGIDSNLFAPNTNLSRAQLAQILYNKESRPAVNSSNVFNDVAIGEWYTDAITWAAANNIVGGYGNGMFGPDDNITREQLAVMLWRYAGEPVANVEVTFNDADQISDFAQAAIRWAVENGILNGKGGNILDPRGFATRAEVAQMLKNYLNN